MPIYITIHYNCRNKQRSISYLLGCSTMLFILLQQKTFLKVFTKTYTNIAVIDGFLQNHKSFQDLFYKKKMKDNVNFRS